MIVSCWTKHNSSKYVGWKYQQKKHDRQDKATFIPAQKEKLLKFPQRFLVHNQCSQILNVLPKGHARSQLNFNFLGSAWLPVSSVFFFFRFYIKIICSCTFSSKHPLIFQKDIAQQPLDIHNTWYCFWFHQKFSCCNTVYCIIAFVHHLHLFFYECTSKMLGCSTHHVMTLLENISHSR